LAYGVAEGSPQPRFLSDLHIASSVFGGVHLGI
jgi:hypothetical protein